MICLKSFRINKTLKLDYINVRFSLSLKSFRINKTLKPRQEVTMNNEYQFVINGVDVNDMSELKKVIRGELDKHDKQLAKEFKKFR